MSLSWADIRVLAPRVGEPSNTGLLNVGDVENDLCFVFDFHYGEDTDVIHTESFTIENQRPMDEGDISIEVGDQFFT